MRRRQCVAELRALAFRALAFRALALGALALCALALTACTRTERVVSDERVPVSAGPSSSVAASPTGPAGSTGGSAAPSAGAVNAGAAATVARKLAAVDLFTVAPGADTARRLVVTQLRAAGLTATEADCLVDRLARSLPGGLESVTLAQLGLSTTPDAQQFQACLGLDRLAAVAAGSATPAQVPVDELRAVVTRTVSVAGTTIGMTPPEADCLAGATAGRLGGDSLSALIGGRPLDDPATAPALESCVSADRLSEIAAR